jgi:putative acetyltransferase
MIIRDERTGDIDAIRAITTEAFMRMAYSSGTEAAIIDALRNAGALSISLVAVGGDDIVGHVAFSPVTISGTSGKWYGLGPVSVRPDRQRNGIGGALIRIGLDRLKKLEADGCVVLGDPRYYRRFGFASDPRLRYGAGPSGHFQRLMLNGAAPTGEVTYHAGFDATTPSNSR